jgi:excisionase family DNA binding protein
VPDLVARLPESPECPTPALASQIISLALNSILGYTLIFIDLTTGLIKMLTTTPRDARLRTLASVLIDKERASRALLGAKWYRITEVASALSVNPATVRRWITTGEVQASRTGSTGRWRIAEAELKRLQGQAAQ